MDTLDQAHSELLFLPDIHLVLPPPDGRAALVVIQSLLPVFKPTLEIFSINEGGN